jgi:imidazolonepropionase-like amidohydrolase
MQPDGVLDDIPTFTMDELRAIVDEAHRERHKVASHANALNRVHNSVEAGVWLPANLMVASYTGI